MINRENLEKLAAYLESLPANYQHFGMSTYVDFGNFPFEEEDKVALAYLNCESNFCGTVACAVGHGPAAGICAIEDDYVNREISPGKRFSWDKYAARFVGEGPNCFENSPEYHWCFSGAWSETDDTHQGAAKRIRYLLANGVPEDFEIFDAYSRARAEELYNAQ